MPEENAISTGTDNKADLRADMALLEGEDNLEGQDDDNLPNEENEENSPEDSGDGEKPEADDKDNKEGEEDDKKEDDKEDKPETDPLTRHGRPTIQQIKGKYPNFFKDFPDMRHMLFREGEYTTVFPTIDDAREAAERAGDFERFSDLLTSGKQDDFSSFLKGISETASGTLVNMAANFLPALYGMDKDMYFKVTSPIMESGLRNAYKTATKNGNENLKNAALVLAEWAFEDQAYATGEKQLPNLKQPDTEEKKDPKYEKEKETFYQQKYADAQTFVNSNASNRLTSEIKKGLDPNGVFNPFTTNLLVKQIKEELGDALEADTRHMGMMNSMWKNAHKAGYAGNWKDRLLSTYLSRARALMPAIRQKIRNEALKGQEEVNESRGKTAERSGNRREVGGTPPTKTGNRDSAKSADAKAVDWGRTSDMDFLNDKVTLRK